MPIEPVHVIEVGRDGKPRLTRVNPLRRWVQQERLPNGQANPEYHPPIVWQAGRFMDDGGRELPLDAVPQYIRDDVARRVPTHTPEAAPAFLRACPIVMNGVPCDRPVLSTEFEAHLVAHAQGTLVLEDR
ncbi:MAG TPA: hypothetical protein VF406_18830, partial [Thermodesulfobacteriota bacterium]